MQSLFRYNLPGLALEYTSIQYLFSVLYDSFAGFKGKESEKIEILKFDEWEELNEEIFTLSKSNNQLRKIKKSSEEPSFMILSLTGVIR